MAGELERVRKALRELGKSLESLHGESAPNDVHKLRTASRRVEAIAGVLQAAGGKKSRRLVKAIEPVRKAAGGVRDMDVLLADARKLARYRDGESLNHLLAHLKTSRQQNAAELQHALHHRRKAVLQDLKEYSKFVASVAKHAKSASRSGADANQSQEKIHSSAMDVMRELGDWTPLDAENLHAFRLKVKQLRYTLQLDEQADAALVEALGDVQRRIGDWHDWHQLEEIARQVLVLEEDRALLDRIGETVKRRFDRALTSANALRGKYLNIPPAMGA
ncbi:MAG: CHAD domain-containing protein [Terracidiphilus sp.]|nr:CHAD domain-containing protein [Terracidiphilus sp.]MDR3798334.1 CHAD domain-containing protein [Terracidiphilus sp.]